MPNVTNNGGGPNNKTVYLVARDAQAAVQNLGYQAVINEVRNNPGTIGNHEMLPNGGSRRVAVAQGRWLVAAVAGTLVLGPMQMPTADIDIWN
jgi:hypothetical protein